MVLIKNAFGFFFERGGEFHKNKLNENERIWEVPTLVTPTLTDTVMFFARGK